MSGGSLTAGLSIVIGAPRSGRSWREAFALGREAHAEGVPLDWPLMHPLETAWFRRGWRYAAAVADLRARLCAADDAELGEVAAFSTPEHEEGARC